MMRDYVRMERLINRFTDMADRKTLLTGKTDDEQQNLLIQIIGTIVKEAMEEEV